MKERLLGFLFCAVLLAYAINLTLDAVHARFSTSLWLQAHWMIYYIGIPAFVLAALAWWMGFFRRHGARWADAAALASIAAIIYLMLGAGYSCWQYCF